MTTFYFVLGMVVVLVIAGVIAMFTVIKTINSLKEQIEYWIHTPTEKTIEIIEMFY